MRNFSNKNLFFPLWLICVCAQSRWIPIKIANYCNWKFKKKQNNLKRSTLIGLKMAMEESLTLLNFWCRFFCFLMPIKAIWFRVGVHKSICSQFVEILLLFLENASFIHSIASVRQNSIVLWMNGASKKNNCCCAKYKTRMDKLQIQIHGKQFPLKIVCFSDFMSSDRHLNLIESHGEHTFFCFYVASNLAKYIHLWWVKICDKSTSCSATRL